MDKLYFFGTKDSKKFENEESRKILGSKGANLLEMSLLGLPVPAGFTIINSVCNNYLEDTSSLNRVLELDVKNAIKEIEAATSKIFGGGKMPLLVSVRSGSMISMPGMMDTVLNLGLNDEVVKLLAENTNHEFAYDCYIRFIEMFSSIVLGVNGKIFEDIKRINHDKHEIVSLYKKAIKAHSYEFPEDPYLQLNLAIKAVITSWNSRRAMIYRKLHNIRDDIGTAVTVQSMVFGNYNSNSGTGVIFSRNPVNGNNELFGEYLSSAQGEDIVSGRRTPQKIAGTSASLEEVMPEIYNELASRTKYLEGYFRDMQDIEFTIENGKLYILQTRPGKRTAASAIKIAYDMVSEELISKEEAILRIDSQKIETLLHPTISKNIKIKPIARGLAASPGAASGKVVFTSEDAELYAKTENIILLRHDTCPEDIKGMSLSSAIITARGGLTSHAAVVARGMGKPCICGVNDMFIDDDKSRALINSHIINKFDEITIDGSSGEIYLGAVNVSPAATSEEFAAILEWSDQIRTLNIRANAETITDLEAALAFGAEGIGLCRTEHMFFDTEKISLIRQVIISLKPDDRERLMERILPLHKKDFVTLLSKLNGKPINIRLIDPPLHEFLPKEEEEINKIAQAMNLDIDTVLHQLGRLSETNPMLGHRGARLGITHPDIYEMQVQAIILAAIEVRRQKIAVNIEIMLPLIANEAELIFLKQLVNDTAEKVMIAESYSIEYKIGSMIELPRAVIIADKIAKHVDYFSFGTNDLTQTIYGISRDDISNFMPEYKSLNIIENDPFKTIDIEGVGQMIIEAVEKGKTSNRFMNFGVCGEHGGDPQSIEFFYQNGINYISCSPYRIPTAKIAAAQAKIKDDIEKLEAPGS